MRMDMRVDMCIDMHASSSLCHGHTPCHLHVHADLVHYCVQAGGHSAGLEAPKVIIPYGLSELRTNVISYKLS